MNQNTPINSSLNKTVQVEVAKRGRKPLLITWPEGEFTASQVSMVNNTVSKVSVHSKINEAVTRGELVFVRRFKSGLGRPQSVYSRTLSLRS